MSKFSSPMELSPEDTAETEAAIRRTMTSPFIPASQSPLPRPASSQFPSPVSRLSPSASPKTSKFSPAPSGLSPSASPKTSKFSPAPSGLSPRSGSPKFVPSVSPSVSPRAGSPKFSPSVSPSASPKFVPSGLSPRSVSSATLPKTSKFSPAPTLEKLTPQGQKLMSVPYEQGATFRPEEHLTKATPLSFSSTPFGISKPLSLTEKEKVSKLKPVNVEEEGRFGGNVPRASSPVIVSHVRITLPTGNDVLDNLLHINNKRKDVYNNAQQVRINGLVEKIDTHLSKAVAAAKNLESFLLNPSATLSHETPEEVAKGKEKESSLGFTLPASASPFSSTAKPTLGFQPSAAPKPSYTPPSGTGFQPSVAPKPSYTPPSGAGFQPTVAAKPSYTPPSSGFKPSVAPSGAGFQPTVAAKPSYTPPSSGFQPTVAPSGAGFQPSTTFKPTVAATSTGYTPSTRPAYTPPTGAGFQPQSSAARPAYTPPTGAGFQPQSSAARPAYTPSTGTGFQPQSSTGTGFQPQSSTGTGFQPQSSTGTGFQPQSSTGTGFQPQSSTARPAYTPSSTGFQSTGGFPTAQATGFQSTGGFPTAPAIGFQAGTQSPFSGQAPPTSFTPSFGNQSPFGGQAPQQGNLGFGSSGFPQSSDWNQSMQPQPFPQAGQGRYTTGPGSLMNEMPGATYAGQGPTQQPRRILSKPPGAGGFEPVGQAFETQGPMMQ